MKATDKYSLRSRVLLVLVTQSGLGLTKIDKSVRETLAEKYRTTKGYGNFRTVLDELIDKHGDLLEDVVKAFDSMKEDAKQEGTGMGDLYDESLYPEAEELRGIYTVTVETEVLPDRTNTVLDLADVHADALREEGAALEKKRLDGVTDHAHDIRSAG